MKNVLIVSSSARRHGNSDTLCDEFAKGAKSAGHKVEKIFLADKKIGECTGCGVCNTTHVCVLKDDMEALLEKLVKADVIVMASPVYFYCVCGRMKTFIDRTCPRYEEISNKQFYFILTAADTSPQAVNGSLSDFRSFLECLENPQERDVIFASGAWQSGDVKNLPAMKKAFESGRDIL